MTEQDFTDIADFDFTPPSGPAIPDTEPLQLVTDENWRELHARQKREKELFAKKLAAENVTAPKVYASRSETTTTAKHVLNGHTPKDALAKTSKHFGKEPEWVADVKGNKSFHIKDTLDDLKGEPRMLAMQTHKVLTQSEKRNLTNSTSFNAMLGQLANKVSLSMRFERLVAALEEQEQVIDGMAAKLAVFEASKPTHVHPLQAQAAQLKRNGSTQKEVALAVGKSLSTVKRWWKEL